MATYRRKIRVGERADEAITAGSVAIRTRTVDGYRYADNVERGDVRAALVRKGFELVPEAAPKKKKEETPTVTAEEVARLEKENAEAATAGGVPEGKPAETMIPDDGGPRLDASKGPGEGGDVTAETEEEDEEEDEGSEE